MSRAKEGELIRKSEWRCWKCGRAAVLERDNMMFCPLHASDEMIDERYANLSDFSDDFIYRRMWKEDRKPTTEELLQQKLKENPQWHRQKGESRSDYVARMQKTRDRLMQGIPALTLIVSPMLEYMI